MGTSLRGRGVGNARMWFALVGGRRVLGVRARTVDGSLGMMEVFDDSEDG